jgi:hypothetical protein
MREKSFLTFISYYDGYPMKEKINKFLIYLNGEKEDSEMNIDIL